MAKIVSAPLNVLDEFQKKSPLDLSSLRTALIEQTRQELPEYTKLLLGETLLGWFRLIRTKDSLELDDINIQQGFQSRGLGSLILDQVKQTAQNDGLSVHCTVSSDNQRALRFYLRHGFDVSATQDKYVQLIYSPLIP